MKYLIALMLLIHSLQAISQEHQLLVGMMGLDLKPKIGIPLAGYGSSQRRLPEFVDWRFRHRESTLFRPSEGQHSPIRSKVMVLRKGSENVVFISLDTIGIEARFVKDIARKLKGYGIKEKNIVVSATHTHGGPGTLSRRLPLEVIAVDFFRKENYDHILRMVVQSVKGALADLRPAGLYKSKALIKDVQKNKWRRKDENHFDNRASFLLAKDLATDQWMGGLVNFSIHGGTMPIGLMHFSSDVNGAIEKELENYVNSLNGISFGPVTFLFMNGAEGDVGGNSDRSVENVDLLAKKFIHDAKSAFHADHLTSVEPKISSRKKKIFVGIPTLPMKGCQKGLFGKIPDWMKFNLYPLLPAHSFISKIEVGDITYLTWPGEASTQLGHDLQELAISRGARDPVVLGLVNDYMTYFTTKDEYKEKAYDSCSSMYGWKGGGRIIKAHSKWLFFHE